MDMIYMDIWKYGISAVFLALCASKVTSFCGFLVAFASILVLVAKVTWWQMGLDVPKSCRQPLLCLKDPSWWTMNRVWWVCNGRCANLSSNFLLSLRNGKKGRICQQICTWMGWLRWWSYRQQQDSEEWPHGRCCRRGPVIVWIHGIHDMLSAFTCTTLDLSRTFHSFCSSASMGFASWLQQGVKDPVNIDKIHAFLTQEFWKNL